MKTHNGGGWYYGFLQHIAMLVRPGLYVEFGVDQGESARLVAPFAEKMALVDATAARPAWVPPDQFYQMTTEEFSKKVLRELGDIDMAFIDADHSYKAAQDDFVRLEPKVPQDGFILIHDTYPENQAMTAPGYSGDSWRLPDWLRELRTPTWDVLTLPFPPGLTLCRRRGAFPLVWMK